MFTLSPLHQIMKEKGITFDMLVSEYGLDAETAEALKASYYEGDEWLQAVGEMCRVLECPIEGVIQFKAEEEQSAEE